MASSPSKTQDDQDFKLVDKFPGYNSASDSTKLDPGFLIRGSKNVYRTLRNTLESRPGLKLRGEEDSTEAGVDASFEWSTNVGTLRILRVSNGKLEVESDIEGDLTWYELLSSGDLESLAGTYSRFVFDTWWENNEQTDRLIMVRGDDHILHWSGGMAIIDSSTATTLTLRGELTWAELGFATDITGEKKIIVDGREATYTGGEGTTTLTGVTMSSGDASTIPAGSVAIQSVFVASAADLTGFNFDFVKVISNQAWYGSYSSRVVYLSADETVSNTLGFLNLIDSNTHVIGDPDNIVLDDQCRGIGVKDGKVILFAGHNNMYIVKPNQNVTFEYTDADGQTRLNFQSVERKILPGLQAALGHEFIDNRGGELVWLDQRNQLRSLGTFATVDSIITAHLSLAVEDELENDDFTGGHLRSVGDRIYITAPNTGRDWMYNARERIDDSGRLISERYWDAPQTRGLSRIALIEGVVYGYSNVNPQLYQLWNTDQWHDDKPGTDTNADPIPYTSAARFSYQNHGRPQGLLNFDMVFIEGYMPEGTPIALNIRRDYQGASLLETKTVSADGDNQGDNIFTPKFFSGNPYPSIGDDSPGDNPLGEGIIEEEDDHGLIPKFRAIVKATEKPCFEYSLELFSVDADARWELGAIGTNVLLSSMKPNFIKVKKQHV